VPEYRGNKTTFWAMYNGEKVAGVTIQRINAGLDTGEIVKEGQVEIGRRSRRTVWRALETLGIELYMAAIAEVKAGTAVYRPQMGTRGPLYRNPKPRDFLMFELRRLRRRLDQ
jgi:methionyl-tRNA formyltransferase